MSGVLHYAPLSKAGRGHGNGSAVSADAPVSGCLDTACYWDGCHPPVDEQRRAPIAIPTGIPDFHDYLTGRRLRLDY
jgi:hypothetical protein